MLVTFSSDAEFTVAQNDANKPIDPMKTAKPPLSQLTAIGWRVVAQNVGDLEHIDTAVDTKESPRLELSSK
jgi:hypothetical protein